MNEGRKAGFWYLGIIVFGVFAELTRLTFIDDGDAVETASNIRDDKVLYSLSIVSDLVAIACYIMTALVLYRLFAPVNEHNARLMLFFTAMSATILNLNLLNQFAPLMLLNDTDAYSTLDLDMWIYFFIELHTAGYYMAQLFFGLWLLPLGLLIIESEYLPKVIGYLLIVAAVAHLIDLFVYIVLPDLFSTTNMILAVFTVVGEFTFAFYILIKGAANQKIV
ncbi:MAG: DUF4386 domain-containing protein [Candidatus Kariarchaeaceae archaeon]|jgi:hypothetical protein